MLSQFANLLRRRRIRTIESLQEFLATEAVFLSQKSTIDYCRARSGLGWQRLVSEPAFLAALESCRWQGMAAVLADMILVTEGFLRADVDDDRQRLAQGLRTAFTLVLERSPAPDSIRTAWPAAAEEVGIRLARAQLGSVSNPGEVARTSGERIFDLLPIHPSVRRHDREIVVNNVRFGMIAFSDSLARGVVDRLDLAQRVAGLVPRLP